MKLVKGEPLSWVAVFAIVGLIEVLQQRPDEDTEIVLEPPLLAVQPVI